MELDVHHKERFDADEREIHEQDLVGGFRELHDEQDTAVTDAYG